jgi:hypothetical protein
MHGKIRTQVAGAARPLVDGAPTVAALVVEAAGRDLDEPFVKPRLQTLAVGRPLQLPRFMRLPEVTAVKELDAPPWIVH